MSTIADEPGRPARGPLVYRQRALTRLTHWAWAVAMFFLLLSGLQIFNAHPTLYWGEESGFEYNNAVLRIEAREGPAGPRGVTEVAGLTVPTTGLLGWSGGEARGFPAWATIPSYKDLGTGRVVHFFFAWVLVGALALWLAASLLNGHLRELIPTGRDLRALPRDVLDHLRLRLRHGRGYNVLQKLAYAGTLLVLMPLMVLTGLTMSPSFNATAPWLLDLFGGRQSARTLHFLGMVLLVGFFVAHVLMVVLAGPLNEMRSMVTGWYRIDREEARRDR